MKGWLSAILAALPCFILAAALLGAWRDPMAWDDGRWIPFGVGLLLLELLLLHSGVFIVSVVMPAPTLLRRWGWALGLVTFYGLTAWGFATATASYELLTIFAIVTLGRLATLGVGGEAARAAILQRSAIGVAAYLFVGFGTVFFPVPPLGVTPEILDAVYPLRGGGLWERHPERALAGAALYFTLMGIAEIGPLRRAALRAGDAPTGS